jgi:hypothetical protein
MALDPLPADFGRTRDGLHRLACCVIAPARKARTGRIGLTAVDGGFGTPPFDDGSQLVVTGDALEFRPGRTHQLTTLTDAAEFVGVDLTQDPGVGEDVPPFDPGPLHVDAAASRALAQWYAFAAPLMADYENAWIWPEHFDLGATVDGKIIGFSPGDKYYDEPYVYVGPRPTGPNAGNPFWNAPFGAVSKYSELALFEDPAAVAASFIRRAIDLMEPPSV